MLLEHFPKAFIGADIDQRLHPPQPDPQHESRRIGFGIVQERLVQYVEDAFRFFGKAAKACCCFSSGKIADRRRAAIGIRIKIKSALGPPCVPCKPVGLVQTYMILTAFTCRLEYGINDRSHCKHGRPSIDGCTINLQLTYLAARPGFLFKDSNVHAARGEHYRANEAAYACSDDNGRVALNDVAAPT